MPGQRPWADTALVLLITILGVLIVRSAWVSDDAFITLRTLENGLAGRGLTYNPIERVQAFTHPLWALWLGSAYAVTREPWLTTMAVGGITSLAAVGMLAWGAARSAPAAALGVTLLLSSKAWVDYATSGLEGPLVFLLLAAFTAELFRSDGPRAGLLVLLVALVGTTRLDALVLVLPALTLSLVGLFGMGDRRSSVLAQLGWLPLLAWHAGALVYYGAALPNTAGAKLGAGIPIRELVAQSGHYFAWTAEVDPATLPVIGLGVVAGFAQRDARATGLSFGVLGYLAYIVWIGGDFMGGRFFAAPVFTAALLVACSAWRVRTAAVPAVAAVALSLTSSHSPLRSGSSYTKAEPSHGVVDERGYYWQGTGWLTAGGPNRAPTHPFARDGLAVARKARAEGPQVVVKSVIGLYGYYAGPDVHVIDRLALADPLLSRLPSERRGTWRIGHFRRHLPEGYRASVTADNQVADPGVHALYAAVRQVTRGDLFAPGRFAAIADLASGRAAADVDWAKARYPEVMWVTPPVQRTLAAPRGLGIHHDGTEGRLALELSDAIWAVHAEDGQQVVYRRRLVNGGPLLLDMAGVDRVLLFPQRRARVISAEIRGE
ncbi:MAG: hypothetical protein KTR31_35310 [Myxococcales bacterium]|nr:hypothetical protein [Myxococcales bacterium]